MNRFGLAFMTLGIGFALAGVATVKSAFADTPTLVPIPASAKPLQTNFGALDYFQASCARCHGDYGSFYGTTFGKNLNDTQLRDVVHDMAFGPAQAPIEDKNLDVLVAWHRALRDPKPFIAVVKVEPYGKGWQLSGEVTPGATLELDGLNVKTKGHTWTAITTSKGPFLLKAKLGEQTTTLDALKAANSS